MAKHRLQFDLNEDAIKEMDQLREETGLPTRAELIRNALRFLDWALREVRDQNASLLIEKDGKLREVVFPFWKSTKAIETKATS